MSWEAKPQAGLLLALLDVGGEKEKGFCIRALQMNPSMAGKLDCCVAFPLGIDISVLAFTRWMVVSFALDVVQA